MAATVFAVAREEQTLGLRVPGTHMKKNNSVATMDTPAGAVSLEKLDGLVEWVISAPAEEVCWRITEIGSIRDWAKAQKQATELRIKAVRLELVSLRKVAQGGLASKIAGSAQLQAAARWLASLTDDEFASVLTEIDGERTPIALYRIDKAQRDAAADALREDDYSSDWEARTSYRTPPVSPEHLAMAARRRRDAASTLLEEIIEEGEPFTVSEAAVRLGERLGLSPEVRHETADGLREMVRSAIRKGNRVSSNGDVDLPHAFTVQRADGSYERVPAARATVGHLFAHEHEVRVRAQAAMDEADRLRSLLSDVALEVAGRYDPSELEPEHMGLGLLDALGDGYRQWLRRSLA